MIVTFDCAECGTAVRAEASLAGRNARCPRCGTVITIPVQEAFEEELLHDDHDAESPPMLPPSQAHDEDLIDMTAMVDIVFFLLIFFLVTSLQAMQAVMDAPTPRSTEAGSSAVQSVAEMENDADNIVVRIEDDDSIWLEDSPDPIFSDQELRNKIRALNEESETPRTLLVVGSADATHGAAVRVFDAGADARVGGIQFLVEEDDEE